MKKNELNEVKFMAESAIFAKKMAGEIMELINPVSDIEMPTVIAALTLIANTLGEIHQEAAELAKDIVSDMDTVTTIRYGECTEFYHNGKKVEKTAIFKGTLQ